ncbi:hypothetical protein AXG93_1988s1150 [Marchantia polymorpha subsp. ruderalis]|nr:hypothetical protein AXG93_1988s1150 [Marchantia polymorpha subsp. ruderalis]
MPAQMSTASIGSSTSGDGDPSVHGNLYYKRDVWDHMTLLRNLPEIIQNPHLWRVIERPKKTHGCFDFMDFEPDFCLSFLPTEVTNMMLIYDIDESMWPVKYFPHEYRLGGGWRKFFFNYGFPVGQLLVFELVEYATFRVRPYGVVGSRITLTEEERRMIPRRARPGPVMLEFVRSEQRPTSTLDSST